MTEYVVVGTSVPRTGLADKVRGAAAYTADLKRPGMLYAQVLRSPHAHATITRIETEAAKQAPGVHAVLTHHDVPSIPLDPDLLPLESKVRFVGDEVAVVAAESEGLAADALRLIEVDYEVLPAVFEPDQALDPDAPSIHDSGNLVGGESLIVERGDSARGFDEADRIFTGVFQTQIHAPAGMETRAALAEWRGDHLTVWKTSRAVHENDMLILTRVLGLPASQIRIVCPNMGGGFGNKDEGRLAVLVALLARQTGRPVRLEYSRVEEFIAGRNRQSSVNRLRIGVRQDGTPTAIAMHTTMNAGSHVASGIRVTRRTGQGGAISLHMSQCALRRGDGLYESSRRWLTAGAWCPAGPFRPRGLN